MRGDALSRSLSLSKDSLSFKAVVHPHVTEFLQPTLSISLTLSIAHPVQHSRQVLNHPLVQRVQCLGNMMTTTMTILIMVKRVRTYERKHEIYCSLSIIIWQAANSSAFLPLSPPRFLLELHVTMKNIFMYFCSVRIRAKFVCHLWSV